MIGRRRRKSRGERGGRYEMGLICWNLEGFVSARRREEIGGFGSGEGGGNRAENDLNSKTRRN